MDALNVKRVSIDVDGLGPTYCSVTAITKYLETDFGR